MSFTPTQIAALLILAAAAFPLFGLFAEILERQYNRWFYRDEDEREPRAIDKRVFPWEIISEEIDVYEPRWEKYVIEVLEITGKYREAQEATVLYLGVTTSVEDPNASEDSVAYAREMLIQHLEENWPNAGFRYG